ncbi:MAG: hypothetical protein KIT65_12825 [Xanthobacteraceae bacterium]|nr:hypothetical protein [Xanthobacteraceae bacterium]
MTNTPKHRFRTTLFATLLSIASMWVISDIGYHYLLPTLGQKSNYNDGPIAIRLYYVFWVGFATIVLWLQYVDWSSQAKWRMFENRLVSALIWSIAFGASVAFVAHVLPALPHFDWRESWDPPELPVATAWYFLPKSIEILFQQLLIIALVVALSSNKISLGKISIYCAALFGSAHLLLAFGAVP